VNKGGKGETYLGATRGAACGAARQPCATHQPVHKACVMAYLELGAKFLLDVLGGCGAVWGCAEAAAVRDGGNAASWRVLSVCAGVFCFLRWWRVEVRRRQRDVSAEMSVEAVATLLLQVFGGAGAVWGTLETVGLRMYYPADCAEQGVGGAWAPGYSACMDTYLQCRIVTALSFAWHLIRWRNRQESQHHGTSVVERGERMHAHAVGRSRASVRSSLMSQRFDLAEKFVLECCGGAGALWGSAEVLCLRKGWGDEHYGQPSFDQWRCYCAVS
jgi:hypothetical protein